MAIYTSLRDFCEAKGEAIHLLRFGFRLCGLQRCARNDDFLRHCEKSARLRGNPKCHRKQ
ncbi:hypothetical protein DCO58_10175 [Helicobacter saguini]|uniref:Uncharacterized protein n=1 Tax=Helicobacter saguini TaxID=1548018 RepID=A0A4U8T5Q3_9HELI|nr:hypothetical protein [Helicobacter saguini]MWV61330.1 hypothetical protein [Helicobacter saguini]MWV68001.1 hypothetical protein [Helicobacter saguini]MWV70532.1 hypothetical protein [Helicobacter saguini]MWV72435.1 hypothetical protein [Helicobacter saguini]TLD94803.1 hypothetical protein LS64_004720 [Helicobacter saguini]